MILKNRLAKGEITVEEFNSLKKVLTEKVVSKFGKTNELDEDYQKPQINKNDKHDKSGFCTTCGYPVSMSDSFCKKCGISILKEENEEESFTKKSSYQPEKPKKKINRQTILIGISVPIVGFFLLIIIAGILGMPNTAPNNCGSINQQGDVGQQIDDCVNNAANDNSLTDTQKSIIKDMQKNCDGNEAFASMQSDSAAKVYHKMCYHGIYSQIQQFKQKNNGTKTS